MATHFEKTVNATEFKATCLDLMDQLEDHRLERVFVTKRGRVVSVMLPPPAAPVARLQSIFGCMKDSPLLPADFDWESINQPAYSDAELDEFLQTTVDQVDEMLRRPRG